MYLCLCELCEFRNSIQFAGDEKDEKRKSSHGTFNLPLTVEETLNKILILKGFFATK